TTDPLLPPLSAFQARTRNRIAAVSALVGFHAASRSRVGFVALAGISFLHVKTEFDSIPSGLVVAAHTQIDNAAGPTVGVEVPIRLFGHFSAVPVLRVHAFTLTHDGAGGF